MIVRVYRVFDKVFLNHFDAVKEIEGWEHKENIKDYWVAINSLRDFPQVIEFDELYNYVIDFGTEITAVAESLKSLLEESK